MLKEIRRKIVQLTLLCLLCTLLSGYASIETERTAADNAVKLPVYVDGGLECTGYLLDGTAYVPLRSFCRGVNLGAVVTWDASSETMGAVMTHRGTGYELTARAGDVYLYINDRIVYLENRIQSRRGNVLVPAAPLCTAFGVGYEESAGQLHLRTDSLEICASGSAVYDPDALKWLSHIINAEAGNQSLEGQICVGNVVLNRVAHENFPDTVADVIFSPNQFCPVKSGTVYCTPDADAVAAAKLCLEGVNLAGESTYYVNPTTGSTAWFRENLTYVMSVGDHDFYF